MPAISTVVFTIGTYAVTMGTVYTFVAMVALSYIVSSLTTPDGLRGSSQTDPGVRAQTPPDTTTPVPVVYGSAFLGGRFVDACIREDQKVMYYVQAISCLSESGQFSFDLTKMYYGDRLITFDTNPELGNRVVSLTDGAGNVDTAINNLLFISLYTADTSGNITAINTNGKMPWEFMDVPETDGTSILMGTGSGLPTDQQWASTGRRMNGLAFAIIRLSYSRESGTTQLQPITYHCTQNLNGTNAAKPGDVWYDYMTNNIYGAAVDTDFVDASSRIALNAYSDELITFNNYSGTPTTQPRYRINGVVDTNKAVLKNIDDIMQASDSWLRYEASTGLWSVTINKAETPALLLNDNNIIGAIVVGTVDLAQTVNVVEAKFPDKTNRDQYNYVTEEVPTALLYPNEPVNKQTLTYELVNDSVQALYLANRVLEQGREDLTITVNTTYVGIQLSAGDVVSVTNSAYGWNQKLFRCMQVQEAIVEGGSLGAQLQLIEYNEQVYENFDITQYAPAGNTGTPSSGYFSALSPPAVVNKRPYIKVPVFDVNCAIPATGRSTYLTLFYTTYPSPTNEQWVTFGSQTLPNSQPFANGSIVTFADISLPTNTYYFAYKVGNESYASPLSAKSLTLNWAPDPANASSFVLAFNPATLQVPYAGGTPSFAGITCSLYGQNGLGGVDFVPAQTDSDVTFVNGTWRIGNGSTTGYGDIVKTNITVPNPTDGGTHADFGQPTAMPASTASMQVPVRYKDLAGVVHQVSPASIQYAYQVNGTSANKYATGYLYQWSTTTPGNPSGTSIYTWADGTMSSYTGANGWQTGIPTNPGIPLIQLWQAAKQITDTATVSTTTVSWTSGYAIKNVTQNGASGIQQADAIVYQWAITIPAAPTGTSIYTWATNSFTAPSGWSTSQSAAPSAGYTLWQAKVSLTDSVSATTTTISWTTSQITSAGYVGSTGASTVSAFTVTNLTALATTPTTITTSGATSLPANNSWGAGTIWTVAVPAATSGQTVWQTDGIYNPTTGNVVWNVPYIASVKFGSLSAISANLGQITSGVITGATIRTAATGARAVLTGGNILQVYDASGILSAQVFGGTGEAGTIWAQSRSAVGPAIVGQSAYATRPGMYGYNSVTGVGVAGFSEQYIGVTGTSASLGVGVYGIALISNSANHGIRGENINSSGGGVQTSGLVGVGNGYDFYAEGGGTNYGPFTGAHDVMVATNNNIQIGYIVVDVKCLIKKNLSNTVFEVEMSSTANQPALGVMVINNGLLANSQPSSFIENIEITEIDGTYQRNILMYPEYELYKNDYDYCAANAVGEGQVYVCGENGDISSGDLIVTSSIAGVGMKQADDVVRNYTVAKARETVTFIDTSTPVLVACIYLCG